MATDSQKRLINDARIRLPGALDAAILQELYLTLTDFLKGSNVWQETVDFSVDPSGATIYEDPDAYTFFLTFDDGFPVNLIEVLDDAGQPVIASMRVPGEVILQRLPGSSQMYTATVSMTLRDPTDAGLPIMPEWIIQRYQTELLDGLLGRMMSQISKPYSSPNTAVAHMRRFQQAVSKARVDSRRGNVYGAQTWRFPRSFT